MDPFEERTFTDARCSFSVRTAVEGGWRYDRVSLRGPYQPYLRTAMPPAVDDLIWLSGDDDQPWGQFRVVARSWHYPQYGSVDYPHVGGIKEGPMLDVIVEAAVGPFVDEVYEENDEGGG